MNQSLLFKHYVNASMSLLKNRGGVTLTNGYSRARPVDSDQDIPKHTDIVVIGGGNIGCMTALELVERGFRVVLCEKGVIAGESSGRSLGYIDSLFLDPAKIEIVARSKTLWKDLDQRIQAKTGYKKTGLLTGFTSKEGLEAAESWVQLVQGLPSIDARIVSKKELQQLSGHWKEDFIGGLYQPSDACAEPQLVAAAVSEAIRQKGGIVIQHCAVRSIETTAGKISSVITEKGEIRCQYVVLAGGAWSPFMAKTLGIDLPQFMAFASVSRLDNLQKPFPDGSVPNYIPLISESGLALRYTGESGIDICAPKARLPIMPSVIKNLAKLGPAMINMGEQFDPVLDINTFLMELKFSKKWNINKKSPYEQYRILTPEIFHAPLDQAIKLFENNTSILTGQSLKEKWAGILVSTPDNMPYISEVKSMPGLIIGSGFYYGLTVAPAAAEALADLVENKTPKIDLNLYRYNRFSDGTPLIFRV